MSGFNDRIIDEFRANGGVVTTAGFGDGLVLLHTTGAKSSEPRINPLMALTTDDGWIVIASAAGDTKHPAWYFNLLKNMDVAVETGTETVPARAIELTGSDYDAAWAEFTRRSAAFEQYKERAQGRVMPIIRLAASGRR